MKRWIGGAPLAALFLIGCTCFGPTAAAALGAKPVLKFQPDGEGIFLDGTDSNGAKHVLHSDPCFGGEIELSFPQSSGLWTPRLAASFRKLRFHGANGEFVQQSSDLYQNYTGSIESQILERLAISGRISYADELYVRSLITPNSVAVDRVATPVASVRTDMGIYRYRGFSFDVHATVFAYLPVRTADYGSQLGYGLEPSASTTHDFSRSLSGTAEAYVLRRMQNTTAFRLQEVDVGLSLALKWVL